MGEHPQIVIQTGNIIYNKPVAKTISSVCLAPSEQVWSQFVKLLNKKMKGRLILEAFIEGDDGEELARLVGTFVVKK